MEKAIILDELKSLLLYKFGINTLNTSDCKFIANEIKNLTKKNISETTIKRILGFASVKHNFSKYTLTLLSDFNDEIRKQLNLSSYETSIEKSRRTTGNEKTPLFAQFEGRFLSNPTYKFSSLLFLNPYHFLCDDFAALNISSCIKNELGIDQANDLIEYVNNHCKNSNSSLIIFIDDFNDPDMESRFKNHLFERLHDFIGEIENSYIKLVISLRSTDWVRFIESKIS